MDVHQHSIFNIEPVFQSYQLDFVYNLTEASMVAETAQSASSSASIPEIMTAFLSWHRSLLSHPITKARGRKVKFIQSLFHKFYSLEHPRASPLQTNSQPTLKMFKRVEKRRRKQEEEEELGLTGEMKEVLGMHDTDSDESDSGSDNSSDSGDSDGDGEVVPVISDAEEDRVVPEEENEGEEESEDEPSQAYPIPRMSVTETIQDPVYIISRDPDVMACALCPGKLLKNTVMAEIHKSSKVCLHSA